MPIPTSPLLGSIFAANAADVENKASAEPIIEREGENITNVKT